MADLSQVWWPAPAKINLFLHVTGRRGDGYHTLQTIFQFLDFSDRLALSPRSDGQIGLTTPLAGVDPERNLVVMAARLLQQECCVATGVDIALDKRLPMGGGLGGGSSDAATVLVVLNRLWRTGLDSRQLARLALQLGADVPVFVRGVAAWGEGVGEILQPVALPERWVLLAWPDEVVPTASLFADPSLTRDTAPIRIADFTFGSTWNDFEPVARRRHPVVGELLDELGLHGQVRMSGSGGSCFLLFDDQSAAEAALASTDGRWQALVCRTLNRSPLAVALAESGESLF